MTRRFYSTSLNFKVSINFNEHLIDLINNRNNKKKKCLRLCTLLIIIKYLLIVNKTIDVYDAAE